MKKNISYLLLLGIAISAVVVVGCKKDDEVVSKFSYELNDYILNQGSQINYGATAHSPATYEFEVILTGSGITWDDTENDITGKGSFVRFNLYSTKSDFIAGGSYVFDGFESQDSLTFNFSEVGIDFDFAIDTISPMEIKTGIINVKKRSNLYEFDFELYTLEKKQIKGMYTGLLVTKTPSTGK